MTLQGTRFVPCFHSLTMVSKQLHVQVTRHLMAWPGRAKSGLSIAPGNSFPCLRGPGVLPGAELKCMCSRRGAIIPTILVGACQAKRRGWLPVRTVARHTHGPENGPPARHEQTLAHRAVTYSTRARPAVTARDTRTLDGTTSGTGDHVDNAQLRVPQPVQPVGVTAHIDHAPAPCRRCTEYMHLPSHSILRAYGYEAHGLV